MVIPVEYNFPRIVASDGFHFTSPLELVYEEPSYYRFKITCAIDDMQLLGGAFMLALFYLLGFFTGIFLLKLLSFVPIIWLLITYYVNRKHFLKIIPSR